MSERIPDLYQGISLGFRCRNHASPGPQGRYPACLSPSEAVLFLSFPRSYFAAWILDSWYLVLKGGLLSERREGGSRLEGIETDERAPYYRLG